MKSSFVTPFDLKEAEKLHRGLKAQGFSLSTPPHTLFQGKKPGITCTLYTSGKLVVQGKNIQEFIEYYLEPEILKTFTYSYEDPHIDLTPRIGVDESGKGDLLGPLCIAGVFAEKENIPKLTTLGVKDSKKLKDTTIVKIAQKIEKDYPCHLVTIFPARYNELYEKFGNLNLLLAWGHATVIDVLTEKTKCQNVIIDQFAAEHVVKNSLQQKKREVFLTQKVRGEQDPVVAAASIVARSAFVKGMQQLEKQMKMPLPKGASKNVCATIEKIVQSHGPQILRKLGKLHFKPFHPFLNI